VSEKSKDAELVNARRRIRDLVLEGRSIDRSTVARRIYRPHSRRGGWQDGLSIKIPESVINLVVIEAVRNAVQSTYQKQMQDTLREMLVGTIFIPLSLIMTVFAVATTMVLISVRAWITSIPFALAIVFGIYYNYLKKRERSGKNYQLSRKEKRICGVNSSN